MTEHICPRCLKPFMKKEKTKSTYCPPCQSDYAVEWAKAHPHAKQMANRRYLSTEKGKIAISKHNKRRVMEHPKKKRANWKVQSAIRNGSLVRQPCEICGEVAEAHHADYSKPLDVRWLCGRHHREITMLKEAEK